MRSLKIHLDHESFRPFLILLDKQHLPYIVADHRPDALISSLFLDIPKSTEVLDRLSLVITKFISRKNKKAVIVMNDKRRVSASGLPEQEIALLLAHAEWIKITDPEIVKHFVTAPQDPALKRRKQRFYSE
ncbi:MAG: hypothetical protein K0S36_2503 [Nitrosospira multiformis]|jgi:hypothetical protein|nr:hypothetical protein [Nitrosospira multiformis]